MDDFIDDDIVISSSLSWDDDNLQSHGSFYRMLEDTSSSSSSYSNNNRGGNNSHGFYFLDLFWNDTFDSAEEFTSQLKPASDISVEQVMSALYFNTFVFLFLMGFYEVLRRLIPSVYAARRRPRINFGSMNYGRPIITRENSTGSFLPATDSWKPLDWIAPIFGVSWSHIRRVAGLDAYFFLRYIRMCIRITAVSTFWAAIILVPTYINGKAGATGWYLTSMTNITSGSWRMWVSVVFMYLFSAFCFFVMKQEYAHYMEVRMNFLAMGEKHVNPQHHYSIMVEEIPLQLRNDKALYDYFNKLYPGKIFAASVIIKLPELEEMAARRLRVTRRLEKSIAYYYATGERPSHILGRVRAKVCGIDTRPFDCYMCHPGEPIVVDIDGPYPERGTWVDSISYYTRDLAECNRELLLLQKKKSHIVDSGAKSFQADNWFTKAVDVFVDAASEVMEDSLEANALHVKQNDDESPFEQSTTSVFPLAEDMTSMYGSLGITPTMKTRKTIASSSRMPGHSSKLRGGSVGMKREEAMVGDDQNMDERPTVSWNFTETSVGNDDMERRTEEDPDRDETRREFVHPNSRSRHQNVARRIAGRLGLDFLVSGIKFWNRQLDSVVASVVGSTMSSTGFVTFLTLEAVTSAASIPLTHKPNLLKVSVAPEPRDLNWKSVHVARRNAKRREVLVNCLLFALAILWSIPLTAIQAFATAEQVARIPGMEWVLTFDDGTFKYFINGYLPVIALLGLIMILPVIFEFLAVSYERRKTVSDVQRSMMKRYFYYQLVNIYVTVTAGSLWKSLADILDHPSEVLQLLGASLPTVVGYFVSLLITKILAGLPMVVLRFGALGRMILLRTSFSEAKLTQRELDQVYRPENLLYGWEFPSQLLVIVICFTYAVICPIILPFCAIFFVGSLMVYKKQVLYVYSPVYESGGSLFPTACDQTLFGLTCGQLTLLGYLVIRQCSYEPFWMMPLVGFTFWARDYFRRHYAEPSVSLSMERAMERDRVDDARCSKRKGVPFTPGLGMEERRSTFDKAAYHQPVLVVEALEPMAYRRNVEETDHMTQEAIRVLRLRKWNHYNFMTETGSRQLMSSPTIDITPSNF